MLGPRRENEDSVLAAGLGDEFVIAVADGLGGQPRGVEASTAALHELPESISSPSEMKEAFDAANTRVGLLRNGPLKFGNLGGIPMTTLAVASCRFQPDAIMKGIVAWAGDTLIFNLVRDGDLLQAIRLGEGHRDWTGAITCCLGYPTAVPNILTIDRGGTLRDFGIAILSDGAWEPLMEHAPRRDELPGFELPLSEEWEAGPTAELLIREAEEFGLSDNASAAVVCSAAS